MRVLKGKRWYGVLGASILAMLIAASVAIAVASSISATGGGPITRVKVVRSNEATATRSTTYVTVPGATTWIHVPAGQTALILARFSAESGCNGGLHGTRCSIRILIGGGVGAPRTGRGFAFDTDTARNDGLESHSMDRSRVLGSGTYRVRVQYAVTDSLTRFRLDDWSLTVERSRRS
ncbi:MAG: hypothetical protein M3312_07240 [Actinomycetota bacterium]|nr:hypothetical protein [Actinomycetota bacterium]